MADSAITTPYQTAMPFITSALPSWMDDYNSQRLGSYDLYDDLYDNAPNTALMLRAAEDNPIYVPTAKRLVNTLARYVMRDWGVRVAKSAAGPGQVDEAMAYLSELIVREALQAQVVTGTKRWLRRGDWCFFLQGDDLKAEGSRLSVTQIDPRTYFPMSDVNADSLDRVIGQQIVEETLDTDGKTVVLKVQTWLKYTSPDHPQFGQQAPPDGFNITYQSEILDLKDWQDPEKRSVIRTLTPQEELEGITALPIYHIKFNSDPADPFGESALKGLEPIMAGINQAISDEDISLAMAGLGQYWTDSGAPVDADDGRTPTVWELGPLNVIEVGAGKKFNRLDGIKSVDPVQKHVAYLEEQAYGTFGVNDIALGTRGAVTESGVALAIRMKPLQDEADDANLIANGILTQMFHDILYMWAPRFESLTFGEVDVASECDKVGLPFDRDAELQDLLALYDAGIVPLSYVHRVLNEKFGFDLTDKELKEAIAAQATRAAQADPYAARTADEAAAGGSGGENASDPSTATVNDGSAAE